MTTTRSGLIATLLGLVALALGLLSPYAMATRAATPDRILVYVGSGTSNPGFTNFGAAAGRPVDTGGYLLADLSSYACILLPPKTQAFSAAEKSAIAAYLAGGGRVLAMGDYATYAPEANATMTDLAATLGAGLSIVNAPVNDAKQSTSNIAASPLTIGVVQLAYGAIAAVAVSPAVNPTAQELVRAAGGTPFVAAAKVGDGIFVLSGDFHVFSNGLSHAYTTHDNGIFAGDLCGTPATNTPPSITRSQHSYQVAEGTTAMAGGTYVDRDGDPVTLSASFGTVADNGNGSWSWSWPMTDGPDQSRTATVTVSDGKGGTASTTYYLLVYNVAPTITALTAGPAVAGQPVAFTATATDPSPDDMAAGLVWDWTVDGEWAGAQSSTFAASFTDCAAHTVTAQVLDKDSGMSEPVSVTVTGVEARFLAPLEQGRYNAVRAGRVVPVQVAVGCGGVAQTGLAPAIQLLKGDASAGDESGTIPVETTSASAADTTGVMRPVEGGYLYNLQVPGDAKAGDLYTIRVRPFGDADQGAGITVVLAIK